LTPSAGWRRNLAALWFAQFTAIFGFAFAFPFLPLYLRQLGVHGPGELALWTGLTAGASGASLAIMSPIWGALADRYGRRAMLLRAMIGGAISVGLMGFARGPVDLLVLRLIQGATAGTVAAATALVASGTPRARVGWALGVLTSAVAVGSALGPLVGGLAAALLGVRAIFWAGGALLAVATIPVFAVVSEVRTGSTAVARRPALAVLRDAAPGAVTIVATLLVCQTLLQVSNNGFQPLVVLRLLQHVSTGVEAITGVAFAASGLSSALAAVLYASPARRFGFRTVGTVAAVLLAASQLVAGYGPSVLTTVLGTALAGVFYGTIGPVIATMIGLHSPPEVQARVFGLASSATAIGFFVGPLGGGLLAARLGVPPAIAACALCALMLSPVLATGAREPAR